MHAFRSPGSGLPAPECSMFLDLLRPGYLESYVLPGLSFFRQIFTAESCSQIFVDECLSEDAFDRLLGLLLTDNQEVAAPRCARLLQI